MLVQIPNTQDQVEIGQYRPMDKGALRGFFSIIVHPSGQKILDCTYFEKDGKAWFNLPQKEKKGTGGKAEYIPIISYMNKEYFEKFKAAVLHALKTVSTAAVNQDLPF
jgi:hypothetical protein